MALLIPDGFAQVLIPIKHNSLARSAAITFGIKNDTGGFFTPALANTILGDVVPAINLDSNCTIGPAVLRVSDASGATGTIEGTTSVPGTSASSTPPPNVAVLVKKITGRLGRRGRGRMFIPWWVDESTVGEDGVIAGTTVNGFNTSLGNVLTNLQADMVPMYLLHDDEGSTAAPSPDEVTSLICDNRVATQRRRLRG